MLNRNTVDPQHAYERLRDFWRMHLAAFDPDLAQLQSIHTALCRQEMMLYRVYPEQCLANLTERIQQAAIIHLELQLPVWAAEALIELDETERP